MSAAHQRAVSSSVNSPFTVDDVPFGVISTSDNPKRRCATAFGNFAIDLAVMERVGYFRDIPGLEGNGGFEMIGNVFSQVCIQHN